MINIILIIGSVLSLIGVGLILNILLELYILKQIK